jgi:hypothetical protein
MRFEYVSDNVIIIFKEMIVPYTADNSVTFVLIQYKTHQRRI